MIRKEIRCAVLSFFLISLGGLLLGLRIYPPMKLDPFEIDVNNLLPVLPGIISVFVLPFMFIPLRVVNGRVENCNCLFGSNLPRTKREFSIVISILFGGALGCGYAGDDMEFDLSDNAGGFFDIVRKGSDRA